MGFIPRASGIPISCWFLFLLLPFPLPSALCIPRPFPDGTRPSLIHFRDSAQELSNFKNSGNVSWIWDQYIGAPGPLSGDDVLHWGPSLGPFHNYSEVMIHLTDRVNEFSEILNMFTIGASYQGLPIPCISLTAPGDSSLRQGFLIVAHHHAREAITVENALFLLDYLLANPELPEVQTLLSNFIIYLIPTLNPDSLSMLHINPWQRKNLQPTDEDDDGLVDEWEIQDMNGDFVVDRFEETIGDTIVYTYEGVDLDGDGKTGEDLPGGVDLNRNYPVAFPQGVDDPRSQLYHGPAPFSEPETQAMQNFTLHFYDSLAFGLSLHSGIEVLLTPWGYTYEPSYHEPFFSRLGAAVEEASGYEWWSATQLYPSFGSWDDWLYGTYDILAVTLETYGNGSALGHSIWDYFNPSADQVMMNCYRVRDALFAMIGVLLDAPGAPIIIVPNIVPSILSTLVTVYIEESKSGFEIVHLEYLYDNQGNMNWELVPLINRGANRYEAWIPAPSLGGIIQLHVYARDYAGHVVYSDPVSYVVSPSLYARLVASVVIVILIAIVLVIWWLRRKSP